MSGKESRSSQRDTAYMSEGKPALIESDSAQERLRPRSFRSQRAGRSLSESRIDELGQQDTVWLGVKKHVSCEVFACKHLLSTQQMTNCPDSLPDHRYDETEAEDQATWPSKVVQRSAICTGGSRR